MATGWDLFPEARSDRVTWSYDDMDPWRLAFTTGLGPRTIEVDGQVVLADGRPTRVDPAEVRARAAEEAVRLHHRILEI